MVFPSQKYRRRSPDPVIKESTRDRIIEVGAEIVHQKGFNNTGIQEILEAAGVPRGSFYFHFKNKEEFGLKVLDYFAGLVSSRAEEFFNDDSLPYIERLRALFGSFIEDFIARDFSGGCPIGNLAQEMGDLSETFREKLVDVVEKMRLRIADLLEKAGETGEISDSVNVHEMSNFILSSWHGAVLCMKVKKIEEPLRVFEKTVFESLLG